MRRAVGSGLSGGGTLPDAEKLAAESADMEEENRCRCTEALVILTGQNSIEHCVNSIKCQRMEKAQTIKNVSFYNKKRENVDKILKNDSFSIKMKQCQKQGQGV